MRRNGPEPSARYAPNVSRVSCLRFQYPPATLGPRSQISPLLARSSQRHQALLVGHLSPENPLFSDRLSALTAALTPQFGAGAGEQATAMLYQELGRQATLLAYVDAFRLITLVCLLCIPLVFLFRSVRPRPGAAAAVH